MVATSVVLAIMSGLHIRRLHDLGYDGFASLLAFVPLVNIGYLLWLLFAPGNHTKNRYGPADDEGNALKKILGVQKTYGNLPY